jgi:hypothetical protein
MHPRDGGNSLASTLCCVATGHDDLDRERHARPIRTVAPTHGARFRFDRVFRQDAFGESRRDERVRREYSLGRSYTPVGQWKRRTEMRGY